MHLEGKICIKRCRLVWVYECEPVDEKEKGNPKFKSDHSMTVMLGLIRLSKVSNVDNTKINDLINGSESVDTQRRHFVSYLYFIYLFCSVFSVRCSSSVLFCSHNMQSFTGNMAELWNCVCWGITHSQRPWRNIRMTVKCTLYILIKLLNWQKLLRSTHKIPLDK